AVWLAATQWRSDNGSDQVSPGKRRKLDDPGQSLAQFRPAFSEGRLRTAAIPLWPEPISERQIHGELNRRSSRREIHTRPDFRGDPHSENGREPLGSLCPGRLSCLHATHAQPGITL